VLALPTSFAALSLALWRAAGKGKISFTHTHTHTKIKNFTPPKKLSEKRSAAFGVAAQVSLSPSHVNLYSQYKSYAILRKSTFVPHNISKHTKILRSAEMNEKLGGGEVWLARNKSSKGGRGFGREDLEFKCEKREMAPSPSSLTKYEFQCKIIQILNGYANSTESTYILPKKYCRWHSFSKK
jgi:hypothetical protein